jgi:hypothetical protein
MLRVRLLPPALLIALAPAQAAADPAPGAEAARASARLEYLRGPGAESCPGEEGLRDRVATQMGGADPFSADALKRVVVAVTRRDHAFEADFTFYDAAGAPFGRRHLDGAATCSALLQDLATSLTLALRPFLYPAAPPAPPVPPPAVAPPPVAPAPAIPPPVEPPPSSTRPAFRVGAGATVGFGVSPAVAIPGFGGFIGVRWPSFSLALEGRGDLPASTGDVAVAVSFRTSLAAGSLAPCFHYRWLLGCGLVSAGAMHGTGTDVHPAEQTSAFVGAGARAGVEVPFSEHFAGQLTGDGLIALVRPRFLVDERPAWVAPPASGAIGLRLVASF